MDTFKQVKDTVLDTAKEAGQVVANVKDAVLDTAKEAGQAVVNAKDTVLGTAKEAVVSAKDSVLDTAKEAGQAVVNAKDTVLDTAKEAGQAVANAAKDAGDKVMEAKERMFEMADKVLDRIRGTQGGALKLLKEDHELVSSLFDQLDSIEAEPASDELREGLFAQLKYELETHANIEERLFYPALRQANPDLVSEAFAEHAEVKQLLAELSTGVGGLDAKSSARWTEKLRELKESVEHHVREEESEVFTLACEVLNTDDLDALGARMEADKKEMAEGEEGSSHKSSGKSSGKSSRKTGKKSGSARGSSSWAAEHRTH